MSVCMYYMYTIKYYSVIKKKKKKNEILTFTIRMDLEGIITLREKARERKTNTI